MMIQPRFASFVLLPLLVLSGCAGKSTTLPEPVPDRQPGVRAPLTAPCDAMDPLRCLLPWPSSTFTAADPSAKTGLRVHVDPASLIAPDDPASINRADGFSRVTPIVTGFAASVDPIAEDVYGGGPVRLYLAQKDHPAFASSVPLHVEVQHGAADDNSPESLVFGYPLRPLEANADYVAVVLDDLPVSAGEITPSRPTEIALGLEAPATPDEAKLAAYHAPTRAALEKAGIDASHVVRVWDFTTRSADDPTRRLEAMRKGAEDAVAAGKVTVAIDKVTMPGGSIAAIVEGHIAGLPSYVSAAASAELTLDAQGLPMLAGTREAPFRVVLPAGTGDYRFVMFGHGTGGSYQDSTFDSELAAAGVAKVSIQFYGWTGSDVVDTFVGLTRMFQGSSHAAAFLMQALADGAAVESSLDGSLGDALAAPTLGGAPNPASGRRPDTRTPMWVGGSLGGIMGLVAAGASPKVRHGVLNVPGAAWTHFVTSSQLFDPIRGLLHGPYQGDLNALAAVAMAQGNFDEIDGASWVDTLAQKDAIFLIQESIGDPVVPNAGSAMVAVVTRAQAVGAVLSPIAGVPPVAEANGRSGITQYRVAATDPFQIHGFADSNTPAGAAAREQITAFGTSVFAGAPKVKVPSGCLNGSCDFSKP